MPHQVSWSLAAAGYNPYCVARCWAGNWATLNEFDIPVIPPEPAQRLLGEISLGPIVLGRNPERHWLSTVADHHDLDGSARRQKRCVRKALTQ